jgi:hypothetical protein
VFLVNVPVGAAAIVLTALFVPESRAPRARRLDPVGQILVIVGLASITYAIIEGNRAGWTSPEIITRFCVSAASFAALASLTPEIALEIENELAKAIGPLAKVLVKKAIPRTVSAQGLRDLLAVSIPDATAREAFLKPRHASATVHSGLHGASGPLRSTGGSSFSRPISSTFSRPLRADMSRPLSTSATTSGTTSASSTSINVQNFNAELQAQLERALSQYIGPLAKTLVRKEAARQLTFMALIHALAQQIDRPDDRAKFLAVAQKMHGGR